MTGQCFGNLGEVAIIGIVDTEEIDALVHEFVYVDIAHEWSFAIG